MILLSSIDTERRLEVSYQDQGGGSVRISSRYRVFAWGNENVLNNIVNVIKATALYILKW